MSDNKQISKFNKILTALLFLGMVFSIIKIAMAIAPNPGHNFTESSGNVIQGDLIYGSATDTLSALGIGVADTILTSSGTAPRWSTNMAIGTLPIGGNWDITSDLTVETPTLFIGRNGGAYTGRVGIGTTNPGYILDVQNGQMNASGGLCIAGDCKIAWSQVGGSGATYYVTTTIDSASIASNDYQNITGLSWSLSASTRYDISCNIIYDASATTIGIGIGWTGPASPTRTYGQMVAGSSGGATVGGTASVGNDTGSYTTSSTYTASNTAIFNGVWENGSTAGTLQMRFRPETATANGIIIKTGSWCKYSTY